MPRHDETSLPLGALSVINADDGSTYDLGRLHGIHVLVLMRHRH